MKNLPNLDYGYGFSVGNPEQTHTCTCLTHTRLPMQVCKPMMSTSLILTFD